ncbi:MAG: hypothetical protein ACREKL_06855 [Chthoniobacterales bacterium]
MDYQLVLQFRGEALQKFRDLGDMADPVEDALGSGESFDGLDLGAHGANLFIYTDNPTSTFERIRPLLKQAGAWIGFIAAYRIVTEERFRILWPSEPVPAFTLR